MTFLWNHKQKLNTHRTILCQTSWSISYYSVPTKCMATCARFICKIWNKISARTCDPTASTWNTSTERQASFEIGMRSLQEECSLHLFQLSIVTSFPSCNIRASFDNLLAVSFNFMHTCWNKMSSNLLLTLSDYFHYKI